jgi:hypothetical protein
MFPFQTATILLVAAIVGTHVQAGVSEQADADQVDGLTILLQTQTHYGRVTWYQDATLSNETDASELALESQIRNGKEDDDYWWDECGDNWPIQCYNNHEFAAQIGVCRSLRDYIADEKNDVPEEDHHAVCMFFNDERNCCVGYSAKVKGTVSMSKILHGFDDALHYCGNEKEIGARVKNVVLNGACECAPAKPRGTLS